MKNNKNSGGFSIVEMSIVVVVVALILSGITAGASLIRSSKSTGVIAELSSYLEANNRFKEIYGYRAGDIPMGPNTIGCEIFGTENIYMYACNDGVGDWAGNGIIDDETVAFWENAYVMHQLNFAKLTDFRPTMYIDEFYDTVGEALPPSKVYNKEGAGIAFVGKVVPASNITFLHVIRIGASSGTGLSSGNDILSQGVIPLSVIVDIDRKIDIPNTPLRGNFFIGESGCYTGSGLSATYVAENTNVKCTANIAEIGSDFTSNSNNQL